MTLDKDLQAVQEVRNLCTKAKAAQHLFKEFSQEEVDKIVAAMAHAGFHAAERLARTAVSETGMGNIPDKILKNQFGTRNIYESIRSLRTVGIIRDDRKNKILEVAEPMGVVAAIIPTTNPTSTVMFKILISVKARNGIVISPHPRASQCTNEATQVLKEAAIRTGAPADLIGIIANSSLQTTHELMHHADIDVILATGGSGLVKAAYSSGKPAYGVGPGNVPVYLDRSADYKKAIADVVTGKSFDYGTICSSEQALIVDAPLKNRAVEQLKINGAYFMSPEEIQMVEKVLVTSKFIVNPELVGKSPQVIAQKAGFEIPDTVKILVGELQGVGRAFPLSAEKLSPVLAFYVANGWEEGIRLSLDILNFGGKGHTAAVHAKNEQVIKQFGLSVPAYRIVVNSPAVMGSVGYTNELTPSLTLGCGTYGGNIIGDNISAHHLMNIKRVAYETKPFASQTMDTNWRPSVYHDWQHRQAPYTKALSSDVSRKGANVSAAASAGFNPSAANKPSSKKMTYGSTGMTEAEVEQVVEEFIKNRS
ncbi:MAG: aldehyde dehydrogenase family protein [bacterium]